MNNYTAEEQEMNRKAWVEALRSGEYEQTTGFLHTDNGYCCLGVACEVSGLGRWKNDVDRQFYITNDDDRQTTVLPDKVRQWLGLYDNGGVAIHTDNSKVDLTELNDGGASFEEIADKIENGKGVYYE